eukprot:CAMPEP_0119558054 /NCGR_PEP_ID=MMETSP1352-20130426/9953_1 /TAXON_ID=265584 /ORGANISM="Stauroneis constricta, Strain CCMP1120" /LENGTH=75 /DNA_ID=CAMNT_0007605275 /DNA_START=63 /DNA_END=290 /DNA_ORIENTATION=-
MTIPAALVVGSLAYLALGVLGLFVVFGMKSAGKLSKDDAGTGVVVVVTATISMWLFWFCAWMHQWHPLIKPIYEG